MIKGYFKMARRILKENKTSRVVFAIDIVLWIMLFYFIIKVVIE